MPETEGNMEYLFGTQCVDQFQNMAAYWPYA